MTTCLNSMSFESEPQLTGNEKQRSHSALLLGEQTLQNSENTPKSAQSSCEASSGGGAITASASASHSNPSPAAAGGHGKTRRVISELSRNLSRSTNSIHLIEKGGSLDLHSPGGEKRRRAMQTSRSHYTNKCSDAVVALRSSQSQQHSSSGNALPDLLTASPAVSSGRISNFLWRIKDRIQKHAIQTGSDWPLPPTLLRQSSGQKVKPASAVGTYSYTPDSVSAREAAGTSWTPGSTSASSRRQDRTRSLDSKENSLTPEFAVRAPSSSRLSRSRAISTTMQPSPTILEQQTQQTPHQNRKYSAGRGTPDVGRQGKKEMPIELLGDSAEPESRVSEWTYARSPLDFYLRKRSSSSIDPTNKHPVRKLSARADSSQRSATRLDTIFSPGSNQIGSSSILDSPAYTSTCSSRTESPVLGTRRLASRGGTQRSPPALTLTVDSEDACKLSLEEPIDQNEHQEHNDTGGAKPSGSSAFAPNRSSRSRQMKDTRSWLAVQEDLPSVITEKSEHSDRSASSYGGDRQPERTRSGARNREKDRATDESKPKPEDASRGEKRHSSGTSASKSKKKVLKRVASLRQGSTSSSDDCSRGVVERVVVDIEPSRYRQSCEASGRLSELNYDEDGTTWGIWGADVDPEELGSAIQAHLQRLMQTTSTKVAPTRQSTIGEQASKSSRHSLPSGEREGDNQKDSQRRSARPSLQESERGSKAGAASRHSLTSQEKRSGAHAESKPPIESSERIEVIEQPSSDSHGSARRRGGCRFFNCIG